MSKAPHGSKGIGYRHNDRITLTRTLPFLKPKDIREKGNAVWVLMDIVSMAEFLSEHVTGDGNKYGKKLIKELVAFLNTRIVMGGWKKVKGTDTKIADIFEIYKAVTYLKTRSGGSWDDDFGANVITQTESEIWDQLVLSRLVCAPFRNSGWLPYAIWEALDPAKPKGDNSFCLRIGVIGNDIALSRRMAMQGPADLPSESDTGEQSQSQSQSQPRSYSPDWDEQAMQNDNENALQGPELPVSESTVQPHLEPQSNVPAEPAPVTLAPSLKKCSIAAAPTSSRKKSHHEDRIIAVRKSLNVFREHMTAASNNVTEVLRVTNKNSSPEQRMRAFALARDKEWLPVADQI
ncbi:unnamed protein product [Mycena citricolor]|uniref:Myb/SANT-like domain-containing protein n=1 Tax=Mycena citricolor TaxID=2018698 RepID=A0AAD2Q0J0_9AGAR|nr:unnamed protein product [Mycena citricolor]